MRHETFNLPRQRTIEELLFHWPTVVRLAQNDWAKDFAKSVSLQSRRRNCTPSPKQLGIMQRMVADLFVPRAYEDVDFPVIE